MAKSKQDIEKAAAENAGLTDIDKQVIGHQKVRLTIPLPSAYHCEYVGEQLETLGGKLKDVATRRKLAIQQSAPFTERQAVMLAKMEIETLRAIFVQFAEDVGMDAKEGRKTNKPKLVYSDKTG